VTAGSQTPAGPGLHPSPRIRDLGKITLYTTGPKSPVDGDYRDTLFCARPAKTRVR